MLCSVVGIMKLNNVGGYPSIDAYVAAKLKRFDGMERSFASLFELMFSEKENIFYEKSEGYKVSKTTYGQAQERILARAAGMQQALENVPVGSVVGLHLQNGLPWIELFWALLRCGYRPLLMNLRLSNEMLEYAIRISGAAMVISDEQSFSVPTVTEKEIPYGDSEALADVAFGTEILLMSSGTSDSLKLCAYTAEEFYHQVYNSFDIIRQSKQVKQHYEGQLKLLTFLPFYHIFGLVAVYIWFAFFSRTFVQLNDLAPQTILNTIRRHKVTHIFAVPLFWEKIWQQATQTIQSRGEATWQRYQRGLRLVRRIGDVPVLGDWFCRKAFREIRDSLFGESICFMITGGSMINPEALEFFNAIGYPLVNGYGMTELSITSVELSNKKKIRNAGFVGKPLASVEYRIADNGHLQVRSKTAAHYIIEQGVTKSNEGWFDTGDLAACENGHYQILGRSDDLIVAANGENLNPNLIEQQLNLPGIRGVCLVGGEKSTLLVSVSRSISYEKMVLLKKSLAEQIKALQLDGLIGRLLFISDPLMLENEFKLNRRRLKNDLAANLLHPVEPKQTETVAETDPLWLQIRDMFAAALNKSADEISANADFFLDEGGSSLDYFAMISQMQQEFAVSISMETTAQLHTVQTLYVWLKDKVDYVD